MEEIKKPFPKESLGLKFLYDSVLGRCFLKLLSARAVSNLAGKYLDSKYSKWLIGGFVKKNNIDLADYEEEEYGSFNDCFSRKIRKELRPVDMDSAHLISPCDGYLSAYRIEEDTVFPIKQSKYSVSELLSDKNLAKDFFGGICLVIRLSVDSYHRYSYVETGRKGKNIKISGKFHTVQPIALKKVSVFTENSREYTVIETDNFGKIVQMEVGAMLVGKICNYDGEKEVVRGEPKGKFLYGGSTIIVLIQKDKAEIPEWVFDATNEECEVPIKMGEQIGRKKDTGRDGY